MCLFMVTVVALLYARTYQQCVYYNWVLFYQAEQFHSFSAWFLPHVYAVFSTLSHLLHIFLTSAILI